MRRKLKIIDDWIYIDNRGKENRISIPHTWNAEDGQNGGNNYYRGKVDYYKEINNIPIQNNERIYLQFDGVNQRASVFFNGEQVVDHQNGYSTFRIDITDKVKEKNIIHVVADNSVSREMYPQKADFTFFGGIYRNVELIFVSENHFDLDYFGGNGLLYFTKIKNGNGYLKVKCFLKMNQNIEKYNVRYVVYDHENQIVGEANGETANINIENVHLWNGIEDPYLYKMEAQLIIENQVADSISTNVGFRDICFDANRGFILNGKIYPLRGVSRHQDWKDMGYAISRSHMSRDIELIREMGANTIRLAHYQHDQYFYDLCDKYGIVVWAEIPYISEHLPKANENTFFQMKELIVQNRHHPCIVTWGISNEITISRRNKKDMLTNHRRLNEFVKRFDPTRPTTLACYALCSPFHPVTKITDLVAWNLYLGWYTPGIKLNDVFMDFYHKKYPKRCLGYSEYGAEGMPNLHSEKSRRGDHTEEYQAKYHEYMLKCFERHPFLWGTYVWNMFDFAADARNQGGEPGMNHKGLVTYDRKIRKDSFYLYKAYWNNKEPFVHLCGKRYRYRECKKSMITVYSNQNEIELFQNGKLIEKKKGNKVFKFSVELEETNVFVAKASEIEDEMKIYKVDSFVPDYRVKKGKSENWM